MTDQNPMSHAQGAAMPPEGAVQKPANQKGVSFDTGDSSREGNAALSGLKKLQDPSKYSKARFSFRLYKKR